MSVSVEEYDRLLSRTSAASSRICETQDAIAALKKGGDSTIFRIRRRSLPAG